ncbi:MAG: DNA polymerase III subunit delta [Candidatus Magasanikbacteria bacterium RIFCSPHIGHO2_02_FULL_50_9b]|uniref:DNA-directed DNA polymerase n=1 Tax=Candidatus Magasanikbacteria bacterium RIFCSPHIGHO2_02_FULL_50_9b TaxID=1798682 RepID=A0A1F6M8B8_9BACT|nr:MAG: DNA polymerase III subunit delta [Candidatus Magasanikbacteria bacterium RIFCSPHIGHO2_02_FULL_50_9b]
MLLYLFGTDTKRSREHLDKLIEKFYRERDPQKLNVKRVIVGGETSADAPDVRAELLTAPFLADKRMVVVERMLENGDDDLVTWFAGRFLDAEPPADTIIILWEAESSKNKLHTRLAQTKFAQEFAPLTAEKREQQIVRAAHEQGAKITADAVSALHRRVADDHELANAIAVLASYAGAGGIITQRDLDLFLPPDIEAKIFDAMDALAARNRTAAMKQLAAVWHSDNDPVYIFAMLHRQVRLLFQTRELLDDNPAIQDSAVAKTLGIHPFVAKKLLQQARGWTRGELVAWYDRLIEIDYAIKHGTTDAHVLIDAFVAA